MDSQHTLFGNPESVRCVLSLRQILRSRQERSPLSPDSFLYNLSLISFPPQCSEGRHIGSTVKTSPAVLQQAALTQTSGLCGFNNNTRALYVIFIQQAYRRAWSTWPPRMMFSEPKPSSLWLLWEEHRLGLVVTGASTRSLFPLRALAPNLVVGWFDMCRFTKL